MLKLDVNQQKTLSLKQYCVRFDPNIRSVQVILTVLWDYTSDVPLHSEWTALAGYYFTHMI